MVKKALFKAYTLMLKKKYSMKPQGARLLASSFLKDYQLHRGSTAEILHAHRRGFGINDWKLLELTDDNYRDFLSDGCYYARHPYNGDYSKWIDDKLTLKYLCNSPELKHIMPEYYCQIDSYGNVLLLMDFPKTIRENGGSAIASLLRNKKLLALKRISGSIGAGFYKTEYRDDTYYLNGKAYTLQDFLSQMAELKDYILTEYLKPHAELALYCPDTCNTIRYLVKSVDGKAEMLKSFIRFGTKKSGFVENYNTGGVLCYIKKDGTFDGGNTIDFEQLKNNIITHHPDTKKELKGIIPHWDDITRICNDFCRHFPQLKYCGFDFVITDHDEVKMLEINSLTSLDSLQMDCPVFRSETRELFKALLS